MALSAEEELDNTDNAPSHPKKRKSYVNPIKQFYKFLKVKSGIPKEVFKGIKYSGNIILWGLGGFLTPGAIMMLGLFILKLAVFTTFLATNVFLGVSFFFAAFNIFSNIYNKIKRKIFNKISADIELIKQVIREIDTYLLVKENANLKGEGLNTEGILQTLKGEIKEEDLEDFENNLYFLVRGLYPTIEESRQRAKIFYSNPFFRFLNDLNLSISSVGQTLGQGFGFWIFAMMTLNIFFPFPLWLVITVVSIAAVSAGIVFINALDNIHQHTGDESLIGELDIQLTRLRARAEDIPKAAPHVLSQQNMDFVEAVNLEEKQKVSVGSGKKSSAEEVSREETARRKSETNSEESEAAKHSEESVVPKPKVDPGQLFTINPKIDFSTKAYDPLFADLNKLVDRITRNPEDFSSFIRDSKAEDYAASYNTAVAQRVF